jgi:hypothetical protein
VALPPPQAVVISVMPVSAIGAAATVSRLRT